MPPRDPAKTAINRQMAELKAELAPLRAYVMAQVGVATVQSLHAVLGSKHAEFLDVKEGLFSTPEAFYAEWLQGLARYIEKRGGYDDRYSPLLDLICDDTTVERYVATFIKRTFLKYADALSKKRPTTSQAEVWFGPNSADYGLLVTPRFVNGLWENDKSEIRHFKKPYFSIAHVLATGLVVPGKPNPMTFADVAHYLQFFEHSLVRLAKSKHQDAIATRYVAHVLSAADPNPIPLLLPEVRYSREKKHRYRLDFMLIEQSSMMRIGFELSPWSTHGHLAGTKGMTQNAINARASGNREAELEKLKAYFIEHGIVTLSYTDSALKNPDMIFEDVASYLSPLEARTQLEARAMAKLRQGRR